MTTETSSNPANGLGVAGAEWLPIESAPRDGTHFLACTGGYGEHWTFNQRPPVVVHYWSNPGEEGFYLSTGLVDGSYNDVPLDLQWWKPLGLEPIAAVMIHAVNPGAAIGAGNRQRVLDWLLAHPGGTNVECAAALGLSVEAVGRHVKAIRAKWPLPPAPTPEARHD